MFYFTLPLIWANDRLLNISEFFAAYACLWLVLTISAPFLEHDQQLQEPAKLSFYQYLYHAWLGALDLWLVFWPFFIFLNLSIYAVDFLVKSATVSVSSWWSIYLMLLGPIVWWTLAVWRGSSRCSSRIWSGLARLMVLSVYFEYGLKIYVYKELPRVFFNCEDALLNYFSCF